MTSNRPLLCHIFDRSFRLRSHLRTHIVQAHRSQNTTTTNFDLQSCAGHTNGQQFSLIDCAYLTGMNVAISQVARFRGICYDIFKYYHSFNDGSHLLYSKTPYVRMEFADLANSVQKCMTYFCKRSLSYIGNY